MFLLVWFEQKHVVFEIFWQKRSLHTFFSFLFYASVHVSIFFKVGCWQNFLFLLGTVSLVDMDKDYKNTRKRHFKLSQSKHKSFFSLRRFLSFSSMKRGLGCLNALLSIRRFSLTFYPYNIWEILLTIFHFSKVLHYISI